MPKVDACTFYFNKDFMHAKNKHCYTIANHSSILANVSFERKQKFIKFVVFYHLLAYKCPMIDYESLKDLFQLLKVKNVSKKHWIDGSRWGMVEVMHEVLLEVTKVAFVVKFLSLQLLQTRLLLLTTSNDYPSTCMWSNNGRGFPSSFV
jgi:hypothetical protein